MLAKEVDVVGSDKKEHFEIDRISPRETTVRVYKINKKGQIDKKTYDRTFIAEETEVVNLYGNADDDVFILSGEAQNPIKLRIIGGEGSDRVLYLF